MNAFEIASTMMMVVGTVAVPLFIWNASRKAAREREDREARAQHDAEERRNRAAQFEKIAGSLNQIQGLLIDVAKVKAGVDETRSNVIELRQEVKVISAKVEQHDARIEIIQRAASL